MELSPAQLRFFETFGYLYFPRLFAPDEITWITEEFDRSIQACGNGAEHDGTKRTMFGGPIEHRTRLCTLIDDERIVGICNGVLGANFNYASGDGNYYSGDTGWHPDGSWSQLFSVKIAFYLDDLTRDTGCLRVLPGSHHPNHFVRAEGIDLSRSMELFGVEPREVPGNLALETTPGDLVIFNHDLYHASFGGDQRRAHVYHEPHPPLHQRRRPSDPQGLSQPALPRRLPSRHRRWHVLSHHARYRQPRAHGSPAPMRRSPRRALPRTGAALTSSLLVQIFFYAPVAQLAEQLTLNQRVQGSSPCGRTIFAEGLRTPNPQPLWLRIRAFSAPCPILDISQSKA